MYLMRPSNDLSNDLLHKAPAAKGGEHEPSGGLPLFRTTRGPPARNEDPVLEKVSKFAENAQPDEEQQLPSAPGGMQFIVTSGQQAPVPQEGIVHVQLESRGGPEVEEDRSQRPSLIATDTTAAEIDERAAQRQRGADV